VSRYQIPYTTLRDWEQGRRKPDAAARAYLRVIDRDSDRISALLTSEGPENSRPRLHDVTMPS
jgi:hypothetical protein